MTTTTAPHAPAPPTRAQSALVAMPERAVQVLVAIALAAGATVSLGVHYWWTVLPLAAILVASTWTALAHRTAVTVTAARAAAIAVGGTIAWCIANIIMAAEYLIVVRDPGFLTLSGLWLARHPSTDIPTLGSVEAAATQLNMLPDAAQAWNLYGDVIQPQGAKMLPATLSVGGWLAGETGVLAANVVIGGVGILAVYALARRFLGPYAALAPAGAIALTVSHIGLSRAGYTEPLTLVLVVAGVLWAWRGVKERRLWLLLAAGITSGATTFIRIDGASFAVGALAGVIIALALSDAPRSWRVRAGFAFAATQAIALVLGYVSLWRWANEYLVRLEGQAIALVSVYFAAALILGIWMATWGPRLRGDRVLTSLRSVLGRRGAIGIGIAVSGLLALLASRPLWMIARRGTVKSNEIFANGVVESFQRSAGLPIDGTRTYAESTMTWMSYYLTWVLVALAILGFGVAAYRMVRRDGTWAVFLGAILAPTLLYLWNPSIIPDQIWAIRRFEPAAMPGFVLAAAVGAWWLAGRLRTASARATGRKVAAVVVLLAPLTAWVSIKPGEALPISSATNVTTREMLGARDQLNDLCEVAGDRPIVLAGTSSHFGSLRVMCDQPVVLALVEPTPDTLVAMTEEWGQAPVVLTRNPDWFTWTDGVPAPAVDSTVRTASYTLQNIPRTYSDRQYTWYAGIVGTDGSLDAVPVPESVSGDS
ncbi:hypothetical protein [Demequina aurantiaca]|uniref:hypothetical protein n=1 Tax=Demequina aurantiaca TaxID=676200 RepID=UPI00128B5F8D|nr:hypothetical protein [Demequina aurantiaca]